MVIINFAGTPGAYRMEISRELSASSLLQVVRTGFERIPDHRAANAKINLPDALMSGFAMFSLKDSSLLEFDQRRAKDDNLKSIYGLKTIPCDTQMRTIVDPVSPDNLKPLFKDVVEQVRQRQVLAQLKFRGHYLVSLDGSNYFSSTEVHCPGCLEKKSRKTGQVTYAHQALVGAIVHPDFREVIPLAPEAIVKQDGTTKNDCERTAAKRFFRQLRQDYPDWPFIITEDALSANAPHLQELHQHNLRYILGVKEGDHAFLFETVAAAHQAGQTTDYECRVKGVIHRFRFINQVPLNASHPKLLVNFIEYWEIDGNKEQHFCWITDFTVTTANVFELMRGGRARWKIENETFNTLKNQGYHFEHNYGHGQQFLSVNLAALMLLAFLVDQVQQLASTLFQAVLKKEGSRTQLWAHVRALFYTLPFTSLEEIFSALLYGYQVQKVVILGPA
jgi:hypothetical protein